MGTDRGASRRDEINLIGESIMKMPSFFYVLVVGVAVQSASAVEFAEIDRSIAKEPERRS